MASRLQKQNEAAGIVASLGCAYVLAFLAFWIAIIVIVLHFVAKFW